MLRTKSEVEAYYDLAKQKTKEHKKAIETLELTKALPEFRLCADKFHFVSSV
jgi:hypothetical protein